MPGNGSPSRVPRCASPRLGDPRRPMRKTVACAVTAWLWAMPGGSPLASELPTPAEQAVQASEPPGPSNNVPGPTEPATPEAWNLYGQATYVKQYHPSFTSPFQGTNSLSPVSNGEETADLTLFLGVRLWDGGALYVNPEIDEGFGFDDTLGLAGFSSGEAYKVGKAEPYFRLQRAFVRQRFHLGGEATTISP